MKVVILAGGLGTRISEESHLKPKPMIEIGGKPIIWHILKHFGHYGFNDFVICLGYRGYIIKEYFANYFLHSSDVTIDIKKNTLEVHNQFSEPWKVTLVDTGEHTATGGRLKKISEFVADQFIFTYGDGVSDLNLASLVEFHNHSGTLATVTAVQPIGRYGALEIENKKVTAFVEKPSNGSGWISAGYFVCNRDVLNLIDSDDTTWELEPVQKLAKLGELSVYEHNGFWQSMDTLRDKVSLENLWNSGNPPWQI